MNTGNYKILVIDDEKHNIDVLNDILSPMYEVLVSKDGLHGIKMAKEIVPDLILLDIIMPDMSGFEVITTLKGVDITRRIPVIFITGLDSYKDEEKGLLLGAADYITKPFRNAIVKARVKTQLQVVEYIRALERIGMVDALTDLPNRRGFDKQLQSEWGRAKREKTPISIMMIDIDKFKVFNDTYGHAQGDIVLQYVAKEFKDTFKRPADYVARWGGEEFVILLPNTDMEGALIIGEHVRANIEKLRVPCASGDAKSLSVTVSIGVNCEIPPRYSTQNEFLSRADKALYAAKEAGRNMVIASPLML
ncbi:MAG: diguanylate cyclase [Oscillospiraceae bacterium]|nr:diguanylate cyclase [Oscillospiraceae bacterium]